VNRRAQIWLGTLVEITWAGPIDHPGVTRAFAEVARLHRLFTAHDFTSETSALNRLRNGDRIEISPDMQQLLHLCERLWHLSDGRFRPTRNGPRKADIDEMPWRIECSDYIRQASTEELDFGGIAKGYVVDAALGVLRSEGIAAAMVNAGGDASAYGSAFRFHCRNPFGTSAGVPLGTLRDGAIATTAPLGPGLATTVSDPVTGTFVEVFGSVCVSASTCAVADGLTKVVTLAPDAPGAVSALRPFGATARFIPADGSEIRVLA
jgi:thiamine biosynthesis lipoprotein